MSHREQDPDGPGTREGPRGADPASTTPSWSAYATPMRPAEDSRAPGLHPVYWQAQLEQATRGALHWGFLAFFVAYGGYYVVATVISAALSGRVREFDPAQPAEPGPFLLLSFVPNLLLGLVPMVFSWWKGQGLRRDFGILPRPRDVVIGLAAGGVAIGAALLLGMLILPVTGGEQPQQPLANFGGQTIWLAVLALFIFVGAPFTEELLMRGALWGALEHYRIPRWVVLVLTALLFAFLHQEAWRLPILFVGGLAIGAARMITGRVSSAMVAHATNNLLPAVLIYFGAG